MSLALIIVFALIIIHIAALIVIKFTGIKEKLKLSFWGPIIMLKTDKGRDFIDWLARPKRFWKWYGNISLAALYIVMFIMVILLLQSAIYATTVPKEYAPSASEVLALPGINPLIPLWYGLLALIVGVILHEFSHGILTRVGGIKVKSMGVLFFGVPIGAFVEPDDEGLREAKPIIRSRVFAAGPGTNFLLAAITLMIFSWGFMGSLAPAQDGMLVDSVTKGFPAEMAGVEPGMIITHMNVTGIRSNNGSTTEVHISRDIKTIYDFQWFMDQTRANDTITLDVYSHGRIIHLSRMKLFYMDIDMGSVNESYNNGKLTEIFRSHSLYIDNNTELKGNMTSGWYLITPNGTYWIEPSNTGTAVYSNITLADKYEYIEKEEYRGMGFFGVGTLETQGFIDSLSHPVSSANNSAQAFFNVLQVSMFLPLNTEIMPFHGPFTETYRITGPLSVLPSSTFWVLANSFYYTFWLSLLIGSFNALPAVPLDGGVPFRDGINFFLKRVIKEGEKRERIADMITLGSAVFILLLIVWILIGPWL